MAHVLLGGEDIGWIIRRIIPHEQSAAVHGKSYMMAVVDAHSFLISGLQIRPARSASSSQHVPPRSDIICADAAIRASARRSMEDVI